MKKLLGGLGLLTLMAFSFTASSQAATATKKIAVTPKHTYDVSKEVTLQGTVSNVVKKPSAGMLTGTHLMLATANGSLTPTSARIPGATSTSIRCRRGSR